MNQLFGLQHRGVWNDVLRGTMCYVLPHVAYRRELDGEVL